MYFTPSHLYTKEGGGLLCAGLLQYCFGANFIPSGNNYYLSQILEIHLV